MKNRLLLIAALLACTAPCAWASVPTIILAIDAGGTQKNGAYVADEDYSGSSFTSNTTQAISTTGIAYPSPQSVYQTQRVGGNFTYTVSGLKPNAPYTVRVDMAETYWNAPNMRIFNITVNGVTMQSGYDIFKDAGAENKAVQKMYPTTADGNGTIAVNFTATKDNAAVAGLKIVNENGSSSGGGGGGGPITRAPGRNGKTLWAGPPSLIPSRRRST